MLFTCQSNEFVSALSTAAHALSPRSTLPILEGVLIETHDEGIRLTCSDGNMTIVSFVPASVAEEGSVVLPGRLFSDVVRKQSGGEMRFSLNANLSATIKSAGSRTTIAGRAADQFPQLPRLDTTRSITLPQALLKEMIQQTSFAVSSDEARRILTGCLLELSNGEVRMVALDGFRLAVRMAPISTELDQLSAVIPGKLLQELSKIMADSDDEMVTLSFGEGQLLASMEHTRVFASLLEGEYIKYRQIIPTNWQTRVKILDRDQLSLCVDRASLMARESKTNLIKLEINGDLMIITSNSELGDVYEEVQIETEGDDLAIAFNVKYLSDVVKAISDDELLMHFTSPISPCVITSVEGGGFTYMVLPVRVNA